MERTLLFAAVLSLVGAAALAASPSTVPPAGLRDHTPKVFALTGARVVVSPGRVLDGATVVVRDGVIEAVGRGLRPPADAAVRDLSGRTIYAGFLDGYSEYGLGDKAKEVADEVAERGPGYWNPGVTPERRADQLFEPDSSAAKWRSQGFAAALSAPGEGFVKGTSAVVLLGEGDARRQIVAPRAALHVNFYRRRAFRQASYPNSPMGAYALVRQALYDADWYARAHQAWRRQPSLPRPETNEALESLHALVRDRLPVVIDARDELYALRADRLAREFSLPAVIRGSGHEYKRLDEIRATGRAFLVPLNFPKPPPVDTPGEAIDVTLEELMHWDLAPENPARLAGAGVTLALTTDGLEDPGRFLARLRRAVERGLGRDAALAAITVTPARLFGVERQLGTVEAGKLANLVVTDGDLFDDDTRVLETWVDGRPYTVTQPARVEPRGEWRLEGEPGGRLVIEGELGKYKGTWRRERGGEVKLEQVKLLESSLSFRAAADTAGKQVHLFSGTVQGDGLLGTTLTPEGVVRSWRARRVAPWTAPPDTAKKTPPEGAAFAVNFPLGDFGIERQPEQPAVVAFTGGTVWTQGPAGRIEGGTVIVRRGKIAAVGRDLAVPAGARVVDCAGKHLTPGLIDAHSHMGTDGGTNESGQAITAEVRIGDFVDPDDPTIYRQLAGGLTAAHVMHGSANPIGGQNQVLKLRWGAGPEALKFDAAPPTIKFALGENVKQANWGERFTTRYPQTRMGVEQLIRDEFHAARDYRNAWSEWNRSRRGIPPRRDLQLEAVAEVIEGRRLVHAHSYRQDEILALMKVFDDFDAKLAVLQHILEGYKVADEMAKRGVGGSTFSDWWAYKFEVIDAIPYNGALMHRAGVLVSFNSDSDELGRRLNTEAAKAVKYGGLSEEEALGFVTLNPAKQLRIDRRVGSLEPGKDADLVVWSGHPLSTRTRCLETWVDGRRYFSIAEDAELRRRAETMRGTLVQKALRADGDGEERKREAGPPRHDEFCVTGDGEEGR